MYIILFVLIINYSINKLSLFLTISINSLKILLVTNYLELLLSSFLLLLQASIASRYTMQTSV